MLTWIIKNDNINHTNIIFDLIWVCIYAYVLYSFVFITWLRNYKLIMIKENPEMLFSVVIFNGKNLVSLKSISYDLLACRISLC